MRRFRAAAPAAWVNQVIGTTIALDTRSGCDRLLFHKPLYSTKRAIFGFGTKILSFFLDSFEASRTSLHLTTWCPVQITGELGSRRVCEFAVQIGLHAHEALRCRYWPNCLSGWRMRSFSLVCKLVCCARGGVTYMHANQIQASE